MVVGPDWLAADADGRRLIDDPADPVRREDRGSSGAPWHHSGARRGGARQPELEEVPETLFRIAMVRPSNSTKIRSRPMSKPLSSAWRSSRRGLSTVRCPTRCCISSSRRPGSPRSQSNRTGRSTSTRTSSSPCIDLGRSSPGAGRACSRLRTSPIADPTNRTRWIPSRRSDGRPNRCLGRTSTPTLTSGRTRWLECHAKVRSSSAGRRGRRIQPAVANVPVVGVGPPGGVQASHKCRRRGENSWRNQRLPRRPAARGSRAPVHCH